jgi:hypothetical protein
MLALGPKQEVVVRQVRGDMRTFARGVSSRQLTGNGDRRVPVPVGLLVDETRPCACASIMPTAAHRSAIEAWRQRFTLRNHPLDCALAWYLDHKYSGRLCRL